MRFKFRVAFSVSFQLSPAHELPRKLWDGIDAYFPSIGSIFFFELRGH